MIIALDNSAFTLLVNPDARPPLDPQTGEPLTHAKSRIEGLISDLGSSDRLLIPTPALAEALIVAADAAGELLDRMQTFARIAIAPFDQRAAAETAMMHHEAIAVYGTKKGASSEPWQKVKFDRQIVAIARVHRADVLYSDDGKMCAFAKSVGLETQSTWELQVPEKTPDLFEE
ncbi:type II toxin-antitoxin system VapC family toxin [Qipengyuania citrea]|uniref:type II toxin-antitoxin system VapC family toxin n=1 Tax=Qipengyuania citrea TaxID=225971 RepID=UPI0012EEDDE0|nr:type II toxin-antitoxin system VapC family toxin [Qipengyuania citrea]